MKNKKENAWYEEWDAFGVPVPQSNIDGKETVGTCFGFVLTVIMASMVLGYCGYLGQIVVLKTKPNISDITVYPQQSDQNAIDNKLDLDDFPFAFNAYSILKKNDIKTWKKLDNEELV